MIWMQAGVNTFIVTVTENVTIANPKYLIRIVHDQTKQEFSCICPDTSSFTDRYNKFVVTQMSSPNNLIGQINVTQSGLFHYYIYEQASTTNLNYTLAGNILEVGKLSFPLTIAADNQYTGYPTTSTVYEG